MILQGQQTLEEKIVTLLMRQANLNVETIHHKISKESKSYSLPAIYKELGKLELQGVVVKVKKQYSLRIPWILDFISLADLANRTYLESPTIASVLPKLGEKKIWHFTDLLRLNNFWAQVLLILTNNTDSKALYTWMPHSWFHLVYRDSEAQYLKSLRLAHIHLYLICGGDNVLDRWSEQFWKSEHITYSFSKSPFESEQSTYLNIIGDYVSTVTLDANISRVIDKLYQSTRSMGEINVEHILSLLQQRVKATMWLEHNPRKATRFKNRFVRHFGIKRTGRNGAFRP